jgi:hypothetical protein
MKVFGIGLNKTGTTTLASVLQKAVGGRHVSMNREALKQWRNSEYDKIYKLVDAIDTFEDLPWPLMYKELYARYNDAKFILTIRKSSDVWFDSLNKHTEKKRSSESNFLAYGYEYPGEYREYFISFYEKHNQEVKDFFAKNAPEKLLTVCWEDGDGWDKICRFLGVEIVTDEFPHRNKITDELVGKSLFTRFKQYIKRIIRKKVPAYRIGKSNKY